MTDYISSKEFERTLETIKDNSSRTDENVSKMFEIQQEFINSQTKINTENKCDIVELKKKQATFIKAALIFLGFFSGFAGIGFYTTAEIKKPASEKKQVLAKVKHE